MFAEMDSFAKAVLNYCSKNLANRTSSGIAGTATASAVAGGEWKRPTPAAADVTGSSRVNVDPVLEGAAAADSDGGHSEGGTGPAQRRQQQQPPRPEEEELCAVVAEQWRLTAATLTRSRCVKGNGDAEARERREVRA